METFEHPCRFEASKTSSKYKKTLHQEDSDAETEISLPLLEDFNKETKLLFRPYHGRSSVEEDILESPENLRSNQQSLSMKVNNLEYLVSELGGHKKTPRKTLYQVRRYCYGPQMTLWDLAPTY